ncbi:hypothetical protein FSP39_015318 [Pinctada imbricata]|uniref:Uncharacterized protein n=1 Tax=Pinctada imbricata TaxID=66713 RepID=A0AA89BXG3_PINIB|nr:hypothetical protein FSP39_015318 [Pinctada imbricata]
MRYHGPTPYGSRDKAQVKVLSMDANDNDSEEQLQEGDRFDPRVLYIPMFSSSSSTTYGGAPLASSTVGASSSSSVVQKQSSNELVVRTITPEISPGRNKHGSTGQLHFEMGSHPSIQKADSLLDFHASKIQHMEREESFAYVVDDNQRTINSMGGISTDTQDSARYEDAPFPCGNIQFGSSESALLDMEPKKHYVTINYDTYCEEVSHFMGAYWRMRSPKIVVSVISGVKHFKGWKNKHLRKQFQRGIIKAANTTEMWIITNGVDSGVSKMIGEAIQEEKERRLSNRTQMSEFRPDEVQKSTKLTLIGIVPKNGIKYGNVFNGTDGVMIKNEGSATASKEQELNPDHTHFIIVDDVEDREHLLFTNLKCSIEQQLQYSVGKPRRIKRLFSFGSDDHNENDIFEPIAKKIVPVIGLFVQGSPRCIDQILFYLSNKMSVLVMKGSGGTADLLAYAFEEMQERNDEDFREHIMKPELIKMITKMYPNDFKDNDVAKCEFRDKILECVDLAHDEDQIFLNVVNMQGWDANLKDLDRYLLKALFNCEKVNRIRWREQLHKDLQLLLDWNRPDLAESEVFQREEWGRIKINKHLFEQSLLKQDREEFVNIFLDQGVQVHKYLNHKKLKFLFERAEEREFFTSVCMGKVLGKEMAQDQSLDQNFIVTDLNRLLYKLAGIQDLVQPYELSMNSVGLYVLDPIVAERKAMNCLIIWAVLMNRCKLAKALWNRCEEPIAVALLCSNMYRELSKVQMELYLRTELEENAQDFGKIALGVLEIGYRDSSAQAYTMLGSKLPDFNNKTVIQIAHDANYLSFIAHPCCQKWITRKLFGPIRVKELDWGFLRLPDWFKILASVFLIFPMLIWISFEPKISQKKSRKLKMNSSMLMNEDSDESDSSEEENLPASKSMLETELKKMKKKNEIKIRLKSVLKDKAQGHKLPFYKQIHLLWSSPLTKFWLTQTFYFLFLGLFCLATLWPTCGNLYLDIVLWLWTATILIELIRRTYFKYQAYVNKGGMLLGALVEIVIMMAFLFFYLFLRIIPHWHKYGDIIFSKTVLSLALIFFFYRLLGTYLPISPSLGPMLVRMKRMIKGDFVVFVRMFLIFLISGGVTIQAVLYPNFPLNKELIRRVLTRPLFSMFITPVDDLSGFDCTSHYVNVTPSFCASDICQKSTPGSTFSEVFQSGGSHMYNTEPLIEPIQKCPYSSFFGYVVTIQYLLICKLVLVTLLFAMFALTIAKVDNIASDIWKFQRYALVVEFEQHLIFPPPFTILYYFYILIMSFVNKIRGCRRACLGRCRHKDSKQDPEMSHGVTKQKRSQNYNYWKQCSIEYNTKEQTVKKEENFPKQQAAVINNIQDDMRFQKKNIKRLNERILELERTISTSRMYLESIFHKLDKTDVLGVSTAKGQVVHVAARQSPYPTTRIIRFPVFDKYVPWEQTYDIYDPKVYTKSKDQFNEDEIIYVDEDLIELLKLKQERELLSEEELAELPPLPLFSPKWNALVSKKSGIDLTRVIDRRSWISLDNQPLRYNIDAAGLPINPMGRTGIRGKGILWRWGPNHVIKAVCTRWRQKYTADNQNAGYLYVEGKRLLEFIAIRKDGDSESVYGLPGDALQGLTTPYVTLCEAFMKGVFNDQDFKGEHLDQGDMIQFFAQFAMANANTKVSFSMDVPTPSASTTMPVLQGSKTSLRTDVDSNGFSACLLYKGYVDDPRNTDNAWVEAEVWNFHYDLSDSFDIRIPEDYSVTWKEVSPNVKLFGNEGAIVQEAARIHDAYH